MQALLRQAPASAAGAALPALPQGLAALWRGSELARSHSPCVPSGFAALDAELPGGGWPTQALSEILLAQPGACEWRLLGPALQRLLTPAARQAAHPLTVARPGRRTGGRSPAPAPAARPPLLLINPPLAPHLPGLAEHGIAPSQLVWIAPRSAAHALWAAEQAIKADATSAVLAWLPEARPEQIRRLQAAALGHRQPVFVLRPAETAQAQSSAAPLRLRLEVGPGDTLRLRLIKRRGPAHEGWLTLPALSDALVRQLAPRLLVQAATALATPERSHEQPPTALARPAELQFQ